MDLKTLGIDLAKDIFQLHGVDTQGNVVIKKRLSRSELSSFVAQLPKCLIGIESCGSSNYWARKFITFGHEVKMLNPQFVKPYVKGNKNDFNDAEAICEAVARPNMRYVPIKEIKQQDIQTLHRVRSQLIKNRTALSNQIRGLLAEYGVVLPLQIQNVRNKLPSIIKDAENELSNFSRGIFQELYDELVALDERIKSCDVKLSAYFKEDARCQRIAQIEGIGVITATAMISTIGEPKLFKNGREFAAWLGLVPRQCSSGGKNVLLGISKRGDRYLRTLLVHGARAVVCRAANKTNKRSKWIMSVRNRRGMNKACVAVANKNARIIWALLAKEQDYIKAA